MAEKKHCIKCGQDKPLPDFEKCYGGGKVYLRAQCRECRYAESRKWYRANREHCIAMAREYVRRNPEGRRRYDLKYRKKHAQKLAAYHAFRRIKKAYGIDAEKYNTMIVAQRGTCRICGKYPVPGKRLEVDHDHLTGQVRGLLCRNCNTGIGRLGDDPETLQAAIDYLLQFQSKKVG